MRNTHAAMLLLVFAVCGCKKKSAALAAPDALDLSHLAAYSAPTNTTSDQVDLGRLLFFDKRLSGDGTMSCATCHDPAKDYTDGRPTSVGHNGKVLLRNTPTLLNLAARRPFFWDGRAETLEEQALVPLFNPDEMAGRPEGIIPQLQSIPEYAARFAMAYPSDKVSKEAIASALAAFERTIVSVDSPFDRYMYGDKTALSKTAQQGLSLFVGKALCIRCHDGSQFTDNDFHNIGVGGTDEGRGKIVPKLDWNGMPGVLGGFKTPILRDVDKTAPYFHDGSVATLEEVMDHYADNGDTVAEKNGVPIVRIGISTLPRISLNAEEKAAIIEFMHALTGTVPAIEPPDPPGDPMAIQKRAPMVDMTDALAKADTALTHESWDDLQQTTRGMADTALQSDAARSRNPKMREHAGRLLVYCRGLSDAAHAKDHPAASKALASLTAEVNQVALR